MSKLSEQGQAILEEYDLTIAWDITFDKRLRKDPETGYPIPSMRVYPPYKYKYHGIIQICYIRTHHDPEAGFIDGSLACSHTLRSEHDLLVWAAKNESKIREEFSDAVN